MRPLAFLALLVSISPLATAQAAADKLAPPAPAVAAKARQEILDVFGPELEKAKTAAAKKTLATKMLGVANEMKESAANRWALYARACDLAAISGDLVLAIQCLDDQSKALHFPEPKLRRTWPKN